MNDEAWFDERLSRVAPVFARLLAYDGDEAREWVVQGERVLRNIRAAGANELDETRELLAAAEFYIEDEAELEAVEDLIGDLAARIQRMIAAGRVGQGYGLSHERVHELLELFEPDPLEPLLGPPPAAPTWPLEIQATRDWLAVTGAPDGVMELQVAGNITVAISAEDVTITIAAEGEKHANCS